MFQVYERIKKCRVALLKLRGGHKMNLGLAIRRIKENMEVLQAEEGNRDWEE